MKEFIRKIYFDVSNVLNLPHLELFEFHIDDFQPFNVNWFDKYIQTILLVQLLIETKVAFMFEVVFILLNV